jgi:hypothetical protein
MEIAGWLPAFLGSCYQEDYPFFLTWLASQKKRAASIGSLVSAICKGKQRRLSTKQTDRKKAMKVAEQYEQITQRKLPVHTVRQTLAELAREASRRNLSLCEKQGGRSILRYFDEPCAGRTRRGESFTGNWP